MNTVNKIAERIVMWRDNETILRDPHNLSKGSCVVRLSSDLHKAGLGFTQEIRLPGKRIPQTIFGPDLSPKEHSACVKREVDYTLGFNHAIDIVKKINGVIDE